MWNLSARKTPERFRKKLINLREWIVNGGRIHWVSPTQNLINWIENQINNIGAYSSQHTYEIWRQNEDD